MPRDMCTRFGRYLYSTKCSWIIKTLVIWLERRKIQELRRFPRTRTLQERKRPGNPVGKGFLQSVYAIWNFLFRSGATFFLNGIEFLFWFLQEVRFIKRAIFPVLMCDAAGRGDTETMKELCGQVTAKTTSFLVLMNTLTNERFCFWGNSCCVAGEVKHNILLSNELTKVKFPLWKGSNANFWSDTHSGVRANGLWRGANRLESSAL